MHGTFPDPILDVWREGDLSGSSGPDRFASADTALAKAAAETIEQFYPGHPWRMEVSHRQGIIKIQLQPFMGSVNWYVIRIPGAKNVSDLRTKVIRACGEILERYKIPRSTFSRDHFEDAKKAIPDHRRFHGFVPT